MLDLRYPALDLAHVEVRVPGEVLADRGLDVAQGAVQRRPAQTDHHGNQAEQEEQQAGVSAADICGGGRRLDKPL